MIVELRKLLSFPLQWKTNAAAKVGKLEILPNGGQKDACIDVAKFPETAHICIATASNELISYDGGFINPLLESGVESSGRFEFDDYAALGARSFPRKLTFRRADGMLIEADIQQLSIVRSFASTEFQPPVGAEQDDWCAYPKTSGGVSIWPRDPITIWIDQRMIFSLPKGFFAASLAIGPDGKVKQSTVLYSVGAKNDTILLDWLRDGRYPIKSCGPKRIAWEFVCQMQFTSPFEGHGKKRGH